MFFLEIEVIDFVGGGTPLCRPGFVDKIAIESQHLRRTAAAAAGAYVYNITAAQPRVVALEVLVSHQAAATAATVRDIAGLED